MIRLRLLVPASVFCFVIGLPADAAGEAQGWLVRIHQAPQTLNYEGTFVYQYGGQLETMRIFHRADEGALTERLVSLTGPAREVIRTNDEVRSYLPDQKSIFIEHRRRLGRKGFLAIVPERLTDLEENYAIELGGTARVAGRPVQQLLIRARDDYRYGYKLWADRETGLLLKADLTNNKGKVLEQFMFTQISIGKHIPDSALAPQTPTAGMIWYRDKEVDRAPTASWRATQLPKGFKLSSSIVRRLPKTDRVVEHLVYSDSLAAVSVFVEKLDETRAHKMLEGPKRLGALYALGKILDGHHVTVVGEVPAKTIVMIGNSLVLVSPP